MKSVKAVPTPSATRAQVHAVGIFWLLGPQLILETTPVEDAERYGDFLTHSGGHLECWVRLQHAGTVPKDIEYEEPPRGRVVYNFKTHLFIVYADRCIVKKKAMFSRIVKMMGLPIGEINRVTDGHYRCLTCLAKMRVSSAAARL